MNWVVILRYDSLNLGNRSEHVRFHGTRHIAANGASPEGRRLSQTLGVSRSMYCWLGSNKYTASSVADRDHPPPWSHNCTDSAIAGVNLNWTNEALFTSYDVFIVSHIHYLCHWYDLCVWLAPTHANIAKWIERALCPWQRRRRQRADSWVDVVLTSYKRRWCRAMSWFKYFIK